MQVSRNVPSFKTLLNQENPLQIVGAIHTYAAILAKSSGFRALYLSGAGVSNAQYGLPDLGMTSNTEVSEEIRRITNQIDLPLLVDADTGFGSVLNVARTVKLFESAGAKAVHIEDQTWPKRCGHLEGKQIVSTSEMNDRIKAAVDARTSNDFMIMARTDVASISGIVEAIERSAAYVTAGADFIFVEAVATLNDYKQFCSKIKVPVLANITEFGQTPLYTVSELKSAGIQMILYPLSAFRMMNQAALKLYQTLRKEGTQKNLIDEMQTRKELYSMLNYQKYEDKL